MFYKVVDYTNGWESDAFNTSLEAEQWLASNPGKNARGVVPHSAEWGFDHRFSEWAWFLPETGERIS